MGLEVRRINGSHSFIQCFDLFDFILSEFKIEEIKIFFQPFDLRSLWNDNNTHSFSQIIESYLTYLLLMVFGTFQKNWVIEYIGLLPKNFLLF